jgi:hypothetical protein
MSRLSHILNLLELWIQQYELTQFERMKMFPILTPKQIEEKLTRLPYKLPKEIIELYEWLYNGHKIVLSLSNYSQEYQAFLDLDRPISIVIDWNSSNLFPGRNVFPFLSREDVIYWTVGSDKQQELAKIYSNDEAEFPSEPDAMSLSEFLETEVERLRLKWQIGNEV